MMLLPSAHVCDGRDECSVNTVVAAHFWMERRGPHAALPNRNDPIGVPRRLHSRKNLDARSGLLHPGSSDEHSVHGIRQSRERNIGLEGVDLTAESIAADDDIQAAKERLIRAAIENRTSQEDHPSTGA